MCSTSARERFTQRQSLRSKGQWEPGFLLSLTNTLSQLSPTLHFTGTSDQFLTAAARIETFNQAVHIPEDQPFPLWNHLDKSVVISGHAG